MRECVRTTWSNADTIWLLEQILSTNLVASRKHYLTRQNKELSKQEDLNTLLFAQDSAVVQMLLDACLSKPMLAGEQGAIDEVRCQICAFVHQQFISNPPLVRLVHFQVCVPCINEGRCVRYVTLTNVDEQCACVGWQTYPLALIPMAVQGIPSLHICLEFIPELLQQPQDYKQVFACLLAATLAVQYPVPNRFVSLALVSPPS